MTSRPGLTEAARWMMTASVIEEVMHTRSPNVSVAHAITSWAGASASSCAAVAASSAILLGASLPSGVLWPGRADRVTLDFTERLPSRKRSWSTPAYPRDSPSRYLRVIDHPHLW